MLIKNTTNLTPKQARSFGLVLTALLAFSLVFRLLLSRHNPAQSFAPVTFFSGVAVVYALYLVFTLLFLRCPHCNGRLSFFGGETCPHCHRELDKRKYQASRLAETIASGEDEVIYTAQVEETEEITCTVDITDSYHT